VQISCAGFLFFKLLGEYKDFKSSIKIDCRVF